MSGFDSTGPEAAYATKDNIVYPGSAAARDAAEVRAEALIEDAINVGTAPNSNITGAAVTVDIRRDGGL